MKLYNSFGPNPHVVRLFLAEKGLELPLVEVDIMSGENRRDEFGQINPTQTTPALELDDGRVISEITVICDYLEELNPEPALVGATPEDRAITRMWCRRIDSQIAEPLANGFRFSDGLGFFKDRRHCVPQAADDFKEIAQEGLQWLDKLMTGQDFICGDQARLPDLYLFCFLDFFNDKGQPIDTSLKNIYPWYQRMLARPTVELSQYKA